MKREAYRYRRMPIGGGGYVTGFLYHPRERDLLYARTDVGGVYRFDAQRQEWISLIEHVTQLKLDETFPISFALQADRPQRLYIACGVRHAETGTLAVSDDRGETFRYHVLPTYVHGNLNGRGAGERLLVDEADPRTLYFASQTQGLWVSGDEGATWRRNPALPEEAMTFIAQRGDCLLVGTAGLTGRREGMRGHSLYVSYDRGGHFAPLEEPVSRAIPGCRLSGLVAQRCTLDADYAYVTFASNGPGSYTDDLGYSCDSGDSADGRIVRYPLGERLGAMEEITPEESTTTHGYSGICAAGGLLLASTICKKSGDSLYLSRDQGDTWTEILHDLDVGTLEPRMPYMRPVCNGGHSIIHWLSDVKINPFDPDQAWFNTGTGVFRTTNLTADAPVFTDWCDGMEETVHLNVYAPPSGEVKVIDIVGDLGGFAFRDVDAPCGNSFADAQENRYITCINADFRDDAPEHILVTPRGNWKGKTLGGLILSDDGAKTWRRLPMPFGLSGELDRLLHAIERPNVNSGWAALSADGRSIVWAVAEGVKLHAEHVIFSPDGGETFRRCDIRDLQGSAATGLMKPFSDRCDSRIFYGFGEAGQLYVSRDGGRTFRQRPAPEGFPAANFGLIDCANPTEIRVESGAPGTVWLAAEAAGLWKLHYDAQADAFSARRLTAAGDVVFRMGLGLGRPGGDYAREPKAVYLSGVIGGEYGFYRTVDEGKSFVRLNTDRQMYGDINSLDGDCRIWGRFYLATGSSGLLYGDTEG